MAQKVGAGSTKYIKIKNSKEAFYSNSDKLSFADYKNYLQKEGYPIKVFFNSKKMDEISFETPLVVKQFETPLVIKQILPNNLDKNINTLPLIQKNSFISTKNLIKSCLPRDQRRFEGNVVKNYLLKCIGFIKILGNKKIVRILLITSLIIFLIRKVYPRTVRLALKERSVLFFQAGFDKTKKTKRKKDLVDYTKRKKDLVDYTKYSKKSWFFRMFEFFIRFLFFAHNLLNTVTAIILKRIRLIVQFTGALLLLTPLLNLILYLLKNRIIKEYNL